MITIRRIILFACSAMLLLMPIGASAQCTAETEVGRRLVLEYATQHQTPRSSAVPLVTTDQVRPLTNPSDSGVCQQLFNVWWGLWRNPDEPKPDWAWTYYQVGSLYYVVAHKMTPPVRQNPDGTFNISLNWSPIFIIDRDYRLVTTIAA